MKLKAAETAHRVEHAQHLEHEATEPVTSERGSHARDKRAAAFIAVLAALLALIELGSNSSQNEFIAKNVEAADLWSFYQAKTVRKGVLQTEKELIEGLTSLETSPRSAETVRKLEADIARYDTEPEQGRLALQKRAAGAEKERAEALSIYDEFEFSAAFLQLAIVLVSLSIIAGRIGLVRVGIGFAAVGCVLGLIAGLHGFQAHIFHAPLL